MNTPQKLLDAIAAVVQKSASNAELRALALDNPRAAIEAVGGELPDGARLRFTDGAEEEELVIALPRSLPANGELTVDQLAELSGGHVYWTHVNTLADRDDKGQKLSREEVAQHQRDAMPAPIRSIFDTIVSWF